MTGDAKPAAPPPRPDPLPPAEHEKAVEQAERQRENRDGAREPDDSKLPQTYPGDS